jgi:hypothetical protein
MIRLFKLCLGLAGFVAFCWFGATVKLGSRTLFAHLRAIADTKESQELVDGTKHAAEPLVDGVRRRITGHPAPSEATAQGPRGASADGGAGPGAGGAGATSSDPEEKLTAADRQRLRRLLGSAERTHASR